MPMHLKIKTAFTTLALLSSVASGQQLKVNSALRSSSQKHIKEDRQENNRNQNLQAPTLIEVYESALQKNLPYLINDRNYQSVLTRVDQAKSYKHLQVSADGSVSESAVFGQNAMNYFSANAGLTASLNLYSKELNLNVNIVELDAQMAERQLAQAQQDLMALVAKSYIELILKEDSVRLNQDKVTDLQKLFEFTNSRVQQGVISKDQSAYVEADLKRAELRLLEASQQRDNLRSKFEQEFSIPFKAFVSVGDVAIPRIDNKSRAEWINDAEQKSLKVQIQQIALEIADKDITKARAMLSPTVTLEGRVATDSSNQNMNSYSNNYNSGSYVGIFVRIPLYDGGLRSAVTKENVYKKEATEFQTEESRRQARFDTDSAINNYSLSVGGISSQRRIIALTQEVVQSTRNAFNSGNVDYTKLLLETGKLYDYKYELAQFNVKALESYIDLKMATTGLTTEDLNLINKNLKK